MKKKVFKILIIVFVGFSQIVCCKKEDNALLPEVETYGFINDSEFTTSINCAVISDGSAKVTERGICWGTNPIPTMNDKKTKEGSGIGNFTSKLTELVQGTTYYAQAYATNRKGTVYGDITSFVAGTISDVDGNTYNMVTIGAQIWLRENLKTTKLNDGTPIKYAQTNSDWGSAGVKAKYCWYGTNVPFKDKYGALYNWYALNTNKLCPLGWHIPTANEWNILINHLGGSEIAGAKLKSTTGWTASSITTIQTVNSSGFTALPGGYREDVGTSEYYNSWNYEHTQGVWWTSDLNDSMYAKSYMISYSGDLIHQIKDKLASGSSVRCIKD